MESETQSSLFNTWVCKYSGTWDNWERPPSSPIPFSSRYHWCSWRCSWKPAFDIESSSRKIERPVYWTFCWSSEQSWKGKCCKLETETIACNPNQRFCSPYQCWKTWLILFTEILWTLPWWSCRGSWISKQRGCSKHTPQFHPTRQPRLP